MTKANFDRKTFLFGLGIVQNRVTDIKNASVRELQELRDGLTVKAITGMLKNHSYSEFQSIE